MKNESLEVKMLKRLIDTPKRTRTSTPPVGIDDMTDIEFRAYKSRLQAERRARLKAKKSGGELSFNTETTRDALADAALMILASNAEGADTIRDYLTKVFPTMPGVPLTVTARATSGEMKPKLLHYAKTSK